jgi:hypothetical protein
MASLTDLVASRMTPEVLQKLAGLAGLSSTNAQRALDALIPTGARRAYDALLRGGFRSAELDILTNDDQEDVPKLARLGDSVPEPDVHVYLDGVRQGGTLVTVHATGHTVTHAAESRAGDHMVHIPARVEARRQTHSTLRLADPQTDEHVLEVVEEELDVGTRQVERGRMRIYSKVSERAVERQVNLRDETMRVQRRPVRRDVSVADPDLFQERADERTEVDEEAVVPIRARGIEEVVLGKDVAEKSETRRETRRRTDVAIEEVSGARRGEDDASGGRGARGGHGRRVGHFCRAGAHAGGGHPGGAGGDSESAHLARPVDTRWQSVTISL